MEFSLIVLLVLFPGIAAMKIHDVITGEGKREFNLLLVSSSMYVVVVYGLLVALSKITALEITADLVSAGFAPITLAYLVGIVLLVGVLAGFGDEWRWLPRFTLWCGLSRRGWRNTWADAFRESEDQWVSVHLADGRRVTGWASVISSSDKRASIFVKSCKEGNALITMPDGKSEIEVCGKGVLVAPGAGVTLVEFLDGVDR